MVRRAAKYIAAIMLGSALLAPGQAQPVSIPAQSGMVSTQAPAWSDEAVEELVLALLEAESHGFPSLEAAAMRLSDPDQPDALRAFRARQEYMRLAAWLRYGLIDQETMQARMLSPEEYAGLAAELDTALASGSIHDALAALAPPVRDYHTLRAEMMRYSAFTPIWPQIEAGASLRAGDAGERVEQLRARLAAEGLYPNVWEEGAAFETRLETAVRRFQGRVNLAPTGRVDRATLRELNIMPAERVTQLRANLEQRRWRSRELGRKHIWVNIADFHLEAWEDGVLVRDHQVMVGGQASSTPEFSEDMQYLVLNPWWGIPGGSARSRFASIRRNPSLVDEYGFRIFNSAGDAISVYEIDWSRWGGDWPYRMSQPPGPDNPMGEVKFIFPNVHNVYIHDTIERDRFIRTRRDFSAGCIRVQDPLELAAWVLDGQDGWTLDSLVAETEGNSPRVIWLDNRIPVHISYWTVVADADGEVRYLHDLYNRDDALIEAIDRELDSHGSAVSASARSDSIASPALD